MDLAQFFKLVAVNFPFIFVFVLFGGRTVGRRPGFQVLESDFFVWKGNSPRQVAYYHSQSVLATQAFSQVPVFFLLESNSSVALP